MNQLTTNQTLDSREVAEMVEKEHSKLLRDIRRYCGYLAEAKVGLGEFFIEGTCQDANNQERPNYLVTRKGCEMIANKLTGQKGVLFTAQYVNKFGEMETALKTAPSYEGLSPTLQLLISLETEQKKQFLAIAETNNRIDALEKTALPVRVGWRDTMFKRIHKICQINGYSYLAFCGKLYKELEATLNINLNSRLARLRKRSISMGQTKKSSDHLYKIDVIEHDPRLRHTFEVLVNDWLLGIA